MSLEDFRHIVRSLPFVKEILIQGLGEPLLHPSIERLVEIAARKAPEVSVATNGLLLSPALAAGLERAGCTLLRVSVDAAPHVGRGSVHTAREAGTTLSNVESVLKGQRLSGTMQVSAMIIVGRRNLTTIPDALVGIAQAGISRVLLEYENEVVLDRAGRGWVHGPTVVGYREVLPQLGALEEAARRLGMTVELGSRIEADLAGAALAGGGPSFLLGTRLADRPTLCLWPWVGTYVTVSGEVTPCCFLPDARVISAGNLLESTFLSVWRGDAMTRLRECLGHRRVPSSCALCGLAGGS